MFSCEFSEISMNTFFTEHLRTAASGAWKYKVTEYYNKQILLIFQQVQYFKF